MSISTEDKPSIAFSEEENKKQQLAEFARIAFQTALQVAYQKFQTEIKYLFPDNLPMQLLTVQEAGRFTGEVIYDTISKTPESCFPDVWKNKVDLQQCMYDMVSHNIEIVIETLTDAVNGRVNKNIILIPIPTEEGKTILH